MKKIINFIKNFPALVRSLLKDLSVLFFNRSSMRIEKNEPKNGYIMIFTLLVVGAAMVIVTYVGHRGSFYLPFSHVILAREKAKMLAMGGVQVAIAQLSFPFVKASQDKPASGQSGSAEQDLLLRILPTLNRWQQFDLHQEVDGVDGKIKICLMCEEGKINLNRIIDFKKGIFQGSEQSGWKAIMQELCKSIEKINKGSDLFPAFEKIVKEAQFQFNDATELIAKKEFASFKDALFYQPPTEKNQDALYLTDIFTVWSSSDKVEPWLFSDSINGLLGLPRVEVDDIKKRKEQSEGWIKNFKARVNWQQDWKAILLPVYGKELRTLPKNIDSVLSTNFAPRYFSVLVHGTVGEVTQNIYAILERNKQQQGDSIEYDVAIKKLYWL